MGSNWTHSLKMTKLRRERVVLGVVARVARLGLPARFSHPPPPLRVALEPIAMVQGGWLVRSMFASALTTKGEERLVRGGRFELSSAPLWTKDEGREDEFPLHPGGQETTCFKIRLRLHVRVTLVRFAWGYEKNGMKKEVALQLELWVMKFDHCVMAEQLLVKTIALRSWTAPPVLKSKAAGSGPLRAAAWLEGGKITEDRRVTLDSVSWKPARPSEKTPLPRSIEDIDVPV